MYDKYPVYDVPQNNIVQRFFGQRWSAIVIEIALTVVITFAAGRAFDLFGPFGQDASATAAAQPIVAPAEAGEEGQGDWLDPVKERALTYILDGRYAAAAAMYNVAIIVDPADESNYSWRGYIDMLAGNFREAQGHYRTLLELEPADFDGHNSLCWAYGETGEFTSAIAHCNAALRLASSVSAYAISLENRCWVQVEMGELSAAMRDCLAVLEISRGCQHEACALAHYNLGRILASQGQARQALREFNMAFQIGSTYSDMYLEIAAFYDTLGYRSAALASYEQYRLLASSGVAGG